MKSIIPWRRRSDNIFDAFRREVDSLYDRFFAEPPPGGAGEVVGTWAPRVDIEETDKEIMVKADLPGVDPKDVDVSLSDGSLILRGEKKEEREEKKKNYRAVERFVGQFYREIPLPAGTDKEKITATTSKGVITVTIPKAPQAQPKKIASRPRSERRAGRTTRPGPRRSAARPGSRNSSAEEATMTDVELGDYRDRLLAVLGRVDRDRSGLKDEALRPAGGEASGGLSDVPLHLADLGSHDFEEGLTLDLVRNADQIIGEIKGAFARLDEGVFGQCEDCREAIARERLKVLPYARLCAGCARKHSPIPAS